MPQDASSRLQSATTLTTTLPWSPTCRWRNWEFLNFFFLSTKLFSVVNQVLLGMCFIFASLFFLGILNFFAVFLYAVSLWFGIIKILSLTRYLVKKLQFNSSYWKRVPDLSCIASCAMEWRSVEQAIASARRKRQAAPPYPGAFFPCSSAIF